MEETNGEDNLQNGIDTLRAQAPMINQMLATLPNPAPRGFFGLKRLNPSNAAVKKAPWRKNKKTTHVLV
jgi:hypothetical protein